MPPYMPFAPLTLAPEAAIDLQMHTTFSDGRWAAVQLLDHVTGEGFALVAITDHERLDTIEKVQRLAAVRGVLVLPAVEMSASWEGQMCDILCFGVRPGPSDLATIADSMRSRQAENVRAVYAALEAAGYRFPRAPARCWRSAVASHINSMISWISWRPTATRRVLAAR
jgi:3',5'-nucleoside bisphosphate phosphatase